MQTDSLDSRKEYVPPTAEQDDIHGISGQFNASGRRSPRRATVPERPHTARALKWIRDLYSPGYNLIVTIGGIAIAESIAMIIVYFYRFLPYYQQVLMDAAVMTMIIAPLLYFLSSRPLLQHIQQRIQTEKILQARLRLIQYANSHTLEELLQVTLNEIGDLTHSTAGYFLFLAADQNMSRLRVWSMNTLESMNTAINGNGHDNVNQADIRAECIRRRRPIVNNRDAIWRHDEGMSERHFPVRREMAVPIVRDEKVVAILGLGNRRQDFTTSDVELVSTLADFAWDIVKHKEDEEDIRERNRKEKMLIQTIHTMQLDIARDLHDTIGQNISYLRMKLDHLTERKIRRQAEMQLEIQSMAQAANESYDLMRGTLAVLQTENSTDLFRLFTRYAEQIEERSSFRIDFSSQGEPRLMSAKRMRQLFYIFREILNNIEKHSGATQVSMQMTWDRDQLHLVVLDNGKGFDPDEGQFGSHYGLRFMKERTELLNGSLTIHSEVGSGTRIVLKAPYE